MPPYSTTAPSRQPEGYRELDPAGEDRDAARVGRGPEHGLDAVGRVGTRHEVARLDRARGSHVGEVVQRLNVAHVNAYSELGLH